MVPGTPSPTMPTSGPTGTFLNEIVVRISPGRFGSSNLSVWRIRSCGVSSRFSPPKECDPPAVEFVNDIRQLPPKRAST
jgi:hypothetical protein